MQDNPASWDFCRNKWQLTLFLSFKVAIKPIFAYFVVHKSLTLFILTLVVYLYIIFFFLQRSWCCSNSLHTRTLYPFSFLVPVNNRVRKQGGCDDGMKWNVILVSLWHADSGVSVQKEREREHLINLWRAQSATETSSGQIELTAQFWVCVWWLLLGRRRGIWFWWIVCAGADRDLSGLEQGIHGRGCHSTGLSSLLLLLFISLGGRVLKQRAGYSDGAESRTSRVEVHLVFIGAGEERGGRGLSRPER